MLRGPSVHHLPGVGIGVIHAGYERRLAQHLGAHSTPSILGLINGKVTFFHNAVVRENLRQFVESLLPGVLVEKVSSGSQAVWDAPSPPHPPPPLSFQEGARRTGKGLEEEASGSQLWSPREGVGPNVITGGPQRLGEML